MIAKEFPVYKPKIPYTKPIILKWIESIYTVSGVYLYPKSTVADIQNNTRAGRMTFAIKYFTFNITM